MFTYKSFIFNPFQINTYIIYDRHEAWILDPGCYQEQEEKIILDFINHQQLNITRIFNTHGHIDHILGNDFLYQEYGIRPEIHPDDLPLFYSMEKFAQAFGIRINIRHLPRELNLTEELTLGDSSFNWISLSGHTKGSLGLYCSEKNLLWVGDVVFKTQIGRSDLPGGDSSLISKTIQKLTQFPLETIILPGHGPKTTVERELSYWKTKIQIY